MSQTIKVPAKIQDAIKATQESGPGRKPAPIGRADVAPVIQGPVSLDPEPAAEAKKTEPETGDKWIDPMALRAQAPAVSTDQTQMDDFGWETLSAGKEVVKTKSGQEVKSFPLWERVQCKNLKTGSLIRTVTRTRGQGNQWALSEALAFVPGVKWNGTYFVEIPE